MVPPPAVSEFTYTFPVKDCKAEYDHKLIVYPKSVIRTDKDCAFVAPIDGTIHEVKREDRWNRTSDRGASRTGRFVSIKGKDGVRYTGGHLSSIASGLKAGEPVKAGTVLGRVGKSGRAQGNKRYSLHFAISWPTSERYWWIRRGMVEPWEYLDAWRGSNNTLSPRDEVMKLRKEKGATHACRTDCEVGRGRPDPEPRPERDPDPDPDPPWFTHPPIGTPI